ncbi:hypothetical protein HanPI659440_Chr09g0344071 [Helianthus annuus]|nr:hypothetical protein HanPI659440_Chr09g0344071 [Helianthus annuus]
MAGARFRFLSWIWVRVLARVRFCVLVRAQVWPRVRIQVLDIGFEFGLLFGSGPLGFWRGFWFGLWRGFRFRFLRGFRFSFWRGFGFGFVC